MNETCRWPKCTAAFSLLMAVLIAFVYHFNIPNPNMILIAALMLSTSIGGSIPGAVCAVMMLGYSLFFFSTDHSFVQFTEINMHKMIVITLGVLINYFCVAVLKRNRDKTGSQLKRTNDELTATNQRLAQTNEELKKVNALLESMAVKDSLTDLRNRHALRQDFEFYVGRDLHVLFFDLDNFKRFNDTKGHAHGDKVLETVGRTLSSGFCSANCYRYGGDEFLVIGENEAEQDFLTICEQVKQQLKQLDLRFSGGYVYGAPDSVAELRGMIRQADEMLYRAKQAGKNQFCGKPFDPRAVPDSENISCHTRHHELEKE